MSGIPGYDDLEFERLYTKLLHQSTGAFFCVIADSVSVQREIAGNMCGRFSPGEVQIIDFGSMGSGFRFSFAVLRGIIHDAARFVFLVNFQLACGDKSDTEFLQVLNLSRDNLAELPYVFVFMMPLYFRIKLARNAPDFNSFFRYRAHFPAEGSSPIHLKELDASQEGFSLANKSLLEYYVEKYGQLMDYESKQAFEIILKILDLNTSLRVLHLSELNRFFSEFIRLLPTYESEFDGAAFEIARVFSSQAEYAKALDWYYKALAIHEKALGAEHLDTATTYNNIAMVYHAQGEYGKALEWYFKSLAVDEKVLGVEHPYTATTYNNIAMVYHAQGEYDMALEWYKRAYHVLVNKLGKDHQITKTVLSNAESARMAAGYPVGFDPL